MSNILCLFHRVDLDGHCSGALVKRKFPEAVMYGINYGDEIPWDKIEAADEIYIVDFRLPVADLGWILDTGKTVHWLDHHKTAMEQEASCNFVGDLRGLRDMEKAGCELTFEYLWPDTQMPWCVRSLGRYDVWDHSDPHTLPIQYAMRMENTWPTHASVLEAEGIWARTLAVPGNDLYDHGALPLIASKGQIIMEYQESEDARYAETAAFLTKIDGVPMLALNKMLCNSKVAEPLFDPDEADGILLFGYQPRNKRWEVRMFTSKPGVDLSPIAVQHGGGGHAGACGFYCSELPFELTSIRPQKLLRGRNGK